MDFKSKLTADSEELSDSFSKSASGEIESYGYQEDGTYGLNVFRGAIVNPGEIKLEVYLAPTIQEMRHYPSGWQPVISCEVGNNKKTMRIVVPSQWASEGDARKGAWKRPNIYTLGKISDSQDH